MPSDEATNGPVASGPVLLAALLVTSCLCVGALVVVPASFAVTFGLHTCPDVEQQHAATVTVYRVDAKPVLIHLAEEPEWLERFIAANPEHAFTATP